MKELREAIELRKKGDLLESNKIIYELVKDNPEDSYINYQYAWSFDIMEEEKKAIPYYEKALKLGLKDEDKKEAYLALGSSYRCIGEYDKSITILKRAMGEFNENSLKVFYAMALFNKDEYEKSISILLKIIAKTSSDNSIKMYKKAIEYYSDNMCKKFL